MEQQLGDHLLSKHPSLLLYDVGIRLKRTVGGPRRFLVSALESSDKLKGALSCRRISWRSNPALFIQAANIYLLSIVQEMIGGFWIDFSHFCLAHLLARRSLYYPPLLVHLKHLSVNS